MIFTNTHVTNDGGGGVIESKRSEVLLNTDWESSSLHSGSNGTYKTNFLMLGHNYGSVHKTRIWDLEGN